MIGRRLPRRRAHRGPSGPACFASTKALGWTSPARMPLNSPCQDVGFICPFVVIDPTDFRSDDGGCSELAPGLMFDSFLPIPDAESLPVYPLVLKLVVCVRTKP